MLPNPATEHGERDAAGCGFIIEAEANFAIGAEARVSVHVYLYPSTVSAVAPK
jgi:hypothetical protein